MKQGRRALVVDSSVIVKWLSRTKEEHVERAAAIIDVMGRGECPVYTSELRKYEVANALLKGKRLSVRQAAQALELLYSFPLQFVVASKDDADCTYAIAHAAGITFYDAVFLALAKTLSAPLVTDNVRHQCRVPGVTVIPLAEYEPGSEA